MNVISKCILKVFTVKQLPKEMCKMFERMDIYETIFEVVVNSSIIIVDYIRHGHNSKMRAVDA